MGIVDELKKMFNMSESKRRSHVGMDVAFWQAGGLGIIESFSPPNTTSGESGLGGVSGRSLPDATLGDTELDRSQSFEMLRRSKQYLAMRKPDQELIERLILICLLPSNSRILPLCPLIKVVLIWLSPRRVKLGFLVSRIPII